MRAEAAASSATARSLQQPAPLPVLQQQVQPAASQPTAIQWQSPAHAPAQQPRQLQQPMAAQPSAAQGAQGSPLQHGHLVGSMRSQSGLQPASMPLWPQAAMQRSFSMAPSAGSPPQAAQQAAAAAPHAWAQQQAYAAYAAQAAAWQQWQYQQQAQQLQQQQEPPASGRRKWQAPPATAHQPAQQYYAPAAVSYAAPVYGWQQVMQPHHYAGGGAGYPSGAPHYQPHSAAQHSVVLPPLEQR